MLALGKRCRAILEAVTFYLYNTCISRFPSYSLRNFYLRCVLGVRIGPRSSVHMGCFFTGANVTIGSGSVVNRNCYLDGRVGLRIGDNVSVSPECYLISLDHDPQNPDFACVPGAVTVGNYAWLGARAMVLPGVTVAEGTVVGAGAVVTKSTEPYSIVAGVPARKIGERRRGLRYSTAYFPLFDTDVQW